MENKRTWFGLLLAITLLLSACSSNTPAPANGTENNRSATEATDGENITPPAEEEPTDPFGKYAEPVTISIGKGVPADDNTLPAGDTVENNQFTRYFEEKLNLKFKADWITATGDSYDQKMALAISSNDLPVAMVVSEKELRAMVRAGQLADLTEVYEQYVSPQVREMYDRTNGKALANATFDGKLMALPNLNVDEDGIQLLWIRQDWLDNLGLQPPQTVDELEEIARAFVEDDPDQNGKPDTFGLIGDRLFAFGPLYSAYNAYPFTWLKDDAGNVSYGTTAPEMKQALAKLRVFYEKGLLDKEFAIRQDTMEIINGGRAGMFMFGSWAMPQALYESVQNDPNAVWEAYLLPLDSKGEFTGIPKPLSSEYFVVRKGFSNPEAIVKYLNLYNKIMNDPDMDSQEMEQLHGNGVNHVYYPLRSTFAQPQVVSRGAAIINQVLNGEAQESELGIYNSIYEHVRTELANPGQDAGAWRNANAWLKGGGALGLPMNKLYSAFTSQTKSMELRWAALEKMESEMIANIIMGRAPLDSFDAFVDEWMKSGGEQIIKEIEEELN